MQTSTDANRIPKSAIGFSIISPSLFDYMIGLAEAQDEVLDASYKMYKL